MSVTAATGRCPFAGLAGADSRSARNACRKTSGACPATGSPGSAPTAALSTGLGTSSPSIPVFSAMPDSGHIRSKRFIEIGVGIEIVIGIENNMLKLLGRNPAEVTKVTGYQRQIMVYGCGCNLTIRIRKVYSIFFKMRSNFTKNVRNAYVVG